MSCVMDVSFEEMKIDDYDEVYELWRKTANIGLSSADQRENIGKFLEMNKELNFVCRHEGKIIGTILCGNDGRRGYIYHVTVAEGYRGRGIGRRLVEPVLERLKSEGIEKCHLFVFADNIPGNGFWSSIGWQKREDIFVYSKNI